VYTSSSVTMAVMQGPGLEDEPYDPESDGLRGRLLAYARSKMAGERAVLSFEPLGLKAVVLNPDFVIGPYDLKMATASVVSMAASGRLLFYPPGGKNFVGVSDVVSAHIKAMQADGARGRYFIGHRNMTYRDFFSLVCRLAGTRGPFIPIPALAIEAADRAAEALSLLAPRLLGDMGGGVLQQMARCRYRSSPRASEELGYSPQSLEQDVLATLRWLKEVGYVR